jgi:hypothetical protein
MVEVLPPWEMIVLAIDASINLKAAHPLPRHLAAEQHGAQHTQRLPGPPVCESKVKARTDSISLRDAIAAYRAAGEDSLDRAAEAVLDRLSSDDRAAAAFAAFGVNENRAYRVLTACIEADELRRTFEEHIGVMLNEQRKDGRLDGLSKAVKELRLFTSELNRQPANRLSASLTYDPSVIRDIKSGLYFLDDAIEARRRIATETIRRLGATRKHVDAGKAAKTAAIGWLADGVRRYCGRPFFRATADLAEAIFGGEIMPERVREAWRTRQREWRER